MQYLIIAAVAVISYLIGSVNFSIILSKALSGKDIRESGSGNAGATNMLRTHGKKMAVVTLILDVLKGVIAILLSISVAARLAESFDMWTLRENLSGNGFSPITYIAAVCVVLGHNFPIFFGFKGGKGVATSLGVVLMLDWKIGLCVAVVAIAIMAITRYVSLGSIIGGALFIILEIVFRIVPKLGVLELRARSQLGVSLYPVVNCIIQLVCILIMGGLLIGRHHANIGRLLKGTENKLSFSKKEK